MAGLQQPFPKKGEAPSEQKGIVMPGVCITRGGGAKKPAAARLCLASLGRGTSAGVISRAFLFLPHAEHPRGLLWCPFARQPLMACRRRWERGFFPALAIDRSSVLDDLAPRPFPAVCGGGRPPCSRHERSRRRRSLAREREWTARRRRRVCTVVVMERERALGLL